MCNLEKYAQFELLAEAASNNTNSKTDTGSLSFYNKLKYLSTVDQIKCKKYKHFYSWKELQLLSIIIGLDTVFQKYIIMYYYALQYVMLSFMAPAKLAMYLQLKGEVLQKR